MSVHAVTPKERRQLRVERLKQIRGLKAANLAKRSGGQSPSSNARRGRQRNASECMAHKEVDSANSKLMQRKIRNRESAELSRRRRINEVSELKEQVAGLERQNWLLQKRVMQLTSLITKQLKNDLKNEEYSDDDDDLSSAYSVEDESMVHHKHSSTFRRFEPAVFKL
jgi:hypothetical protein